MKNILESLRVVTFWFSPAFINMSIFGCFLLADGEITVEKTFVILSTVNVIQV